MLARQPAGTAWSGLTTQGIAAPILLVEDSDDDAVLLRAAFDKAGYRIPLMRVADGSQALNYLDGQGVYADRSRCPFPLFVLLDLKMPGMDGFELLARIRRSPHKNLPVIILTDSSYGADARRAISLGAKSFMTKSQDFNELLRAVHRIGELWVAQNTKPTGVQMAWRTQMDGGAALQG